MPDPFCISSTWDSSPPGLGEVFATLMNAKLNVLSLEGWFPSTMSMPLCAKDCALCPELTIARLARQTPALCNRTGMNGW